MLRSYLVPEFREIIPEGEYVVWATAPNFFSFILPTVLLFLVALLYSFTVFDVVASELRMNFMSISSTAKAIELSNIDWRLVKGEMLNEQLNWSVLLKMLPITFCFWKLLRTIKSHSHMCYAKTNKRLILREGARGQNYTSIYLDKITNSQVSVSFFDIAFRTGSIVFYTGQKDSDGDSVSTGVMKSIPNPYEAYREINKKHI
ncbi:hypothetical protein BBN02_05080 [Vibrio parahaemolyticus]|uniref:PH domain-containing protein n=1 Tax=Vibrio parahaemolyticus TaxID=670 RepID=UPI00084B8D19|nr:PH domain-containing protein [Vibrio parahaemolyticus]ODZ39539.1 hypothetical protein BBN02_05080 [Vibrio parahaemolyticus]